MNRRNFPFDKRNYLVIALGVCVIILGYLLMSGPSSTEQHFEPAIFSTRRIVVAPIVCLIGFFSIIVGIMLRPATRPEDNSHTVAPPTQQAHTPSQP